MSNLTKVGAPSVSDFWGEMDSKDFAIPSVLVGQPTSSKGKVGEFNYNNGFSVPTLKGVSLLVPSKTRRMFAGKGKPTRCGSSNFHTPDERYENPVAKNCMSCGAAEWEMNDTKAALIKEIGARHDGVRPLCDQTYTLLFVDENGVPFFMDFRGAALKVIQEKLFSRIRLQFSTVPAYAVQFDMNLKRVDAKQGVYYETVFDNFVIGAEERAEACENLYNMYSKRAANLREDQIKKMDDDNAKGDDEVPF